MVGLNGGRECKINCVDGMVERDCVGCLGRIILNRAHCYARRLREAVQALVVPLQLVVILDETYVVGASPRPTDSSWFRSFSHRLHFAGEP